MDTIDAVLDKANEKPGSLTEITDLSANNTDTESQNYGLKAKKYGFKRPFARGLRSPAAMMLCSVFAMSEALFLVGADYLKQYNFPVEAKPFLISSTIAGVTTLVAFTYFYGKCLLEGERQGKVMPFQRSPVEMIFTYLLNSTRAQNRD